MQFYEQQLQRMEDLGHEPVPFEDVLCQLSDMIEPTTNGVFHLSDFVRPSKLENVSLARHLFVSQRVPMCW